MKHFDSAALQKLPSRNRAHLINTCTGYKPANLIGSKDKKGTTNLAVFNSVVHIGSHPAMLGFILRPLTVRRDTYENFKETGFFTVNQINSSIIKKAHHTAASYEEDISEFSTSGLTEMYLDNFYAPYVEESKIKIGCKYINEYTFKENGCLLIIGAIEHLYISENYIAEDGWVHLDQLDTAAIIGLDGYALPKILDRFNYQKPNEPTKSIR